MKLIRILTGAALVSGMLAAAAQAADETQTFQLKNRLRVEYDDNVYERNTDTDASYKIIEEIEFLANLNFEQSFVGLRYRPTFVWWENRNPDDTDLHHDFDLILQHKFSTRMVLNLKDTFRLAEEPREIDRGSTIRERDDFVYNVADGSLDYYVAPKTRLDLGGRYTLLRYDRNEVADVEDYDIYASGLTLRQELSTQTTVLGEYRYENISYEGPDRGSDSQYIGAGVEEIFSPNLLANVRAGAQFKQYSDDAIDDDTSPYVDGSVTYLPSPRTRLTAGLGYSLFEADVSTYANQERLIGYLSMAYDLTARISLYAAASIQRGDYNEDQSIAEPGTVIDAGENGKKSVVADGTEEATQFSARASYKVNRSNWVDAGWEYFTLNSDLREDFDRNRVSLGWRTQL